MMSEEMYAKYNRLNDRILELGNLNGNIARLAFFINENEIDNDDKNALYSQLDAMLKYRDILEERIECGNY